MGVETTELLGIGTTFGPIPSHLTLTDPAILIGHMASDNRSDVHTVKLNVNRHSEGTALGEWVPFVQAARDDSEQNMEALIKDGLLHYRVIRTVRPQEQLFIWYSKEYAIILGIPEIQSSYVKEGGILCCPGCGQTFRYSNSLRAHMRFKCKLRHQLSISDRNSVQNLNLPNYLRGEAGSVKFYPHTSGLGNSNPLGHSNPLGGQLPMQTSPTLSVASACSSSSVSPGRERLLDTPRERESPEKRKSESPSSETVRKKLRLDVSPEARSYIQTTRAPENGSPNSLDADEMGSAFRKVVQRSSLSPETNTLSEDPAESPSQFAIPFSGATAPLFGPTRMPAHGSAVVGLGIPPFVPGPPLNKSLPQYLTDINKNSYKPEDLANNLNKLLDERNLENSSLYSNLSGYTDRRLRMLLPFYRSSNPMVEKLLHGRNGSVAPSFQTLNLAQNWCAKCNASFRMTSDLVYHMRSHHTREFDHMKKKRDEKLRCDVCAETFRERHHLTRHMTSHLQDA